MRYSAELLSTLVLNFKPFEPQTQPELHIRSNFIEFQLHRLSLLLLCNLGRRLTNIILLENSINAHTGDRLIITRDFIHTKIDLHIIIYSLISVFFFLFLTVPK
jgi:hypothetical protein